MIFNNIYSNDGANSSKSENNIYSNDLDNWNVKQEGERSQAVQLVREHMNSLQFCGANSSKQKSIIFGIMASTREGAIGKDNNLMWRYPEELEYFKQMTKGQIMVMGRKTFEALPESIFVGRTAIVFSRNHPLKRAITHEVVSNIKEFISIINKFDKQQIFMIGGAEIANLFLKENLITEFFLTKINKSYSADTYIDLRLFANWDEQIISSNDDYIITKLTNPNGGKYEFFRIT